MKTACYFVCLLLFCWFGNVTQGHTISWVRQFGSNTVDEAHGVFTDGSGNVYTTGYTGGDFFGSHAGHVDVFLAKHDTNGVLQWSRQFGTSNQDEGSGVAADGLGNVYVTGFTDGDLNGRNAGSSDGFLLKLNSDGVLKWKQQFGTGAAETSDAVSVDELENIYVSGHTYGNLEGISAGDADAFLSKYDHDGGRVWTRQVGTALVDYSSSVHADQAGYIYISGGTAGSLAGPNSGGTDAFVSKYDLFGAHIWTRQFGSSSDDATQKVTTDDHGNVYVAGTTRGSIAGRNAGIRDPFVAKFDANGTLLWARQFGTVHDEQAAFAASDGVGNVYVTGETEGSLGGTNVGRTDVYIAKYDPDGNRQWLDNVATPQKEDSYDIVTDHLGNVYIAGMSYGSLDGSVFKNSAAFLLKISDRSVPEPASGVLVIAGIILISVARRNPRLRYADSARCHRTTPTSRQQCATARTYIS